MRHNGRMTEIVTLDNGVWQAQILPSLGGVVLTGRVSLGGTWTDVMRPSPAGLDAFGEAASYPLIPWSNRIKDATLAWRGETHRLEVSHSDGTAIHGTSADKPWTVVDEDATEVTLAFDSREHEGINWPWPFTSSIAYTLDGADFTVAASVTNEGDAPFPAGIGHHPYFERQVAGARASLQLNCATAYEAVGCIPSAAAGPIRQGADFTSPTPVGGWFVDDCYTGRTSRVLATMTWPGVLDVDVLADEAFSHAVVYVPDGQSFFAVEPVTHANDGFNLAERGVEGVGVVELAPGETLTASFTMRARVA